MNLPIETTSDPAAAEYRRIRLAHWDAIAGSDRYRGAGAYYHRRLAQIYGFLIPPKMRVLEIGCGRGDLLAALKPSVGVGVDFSPPAIEQAIAAHPDLRFILQDAHELQLDEKFDAIILSDLINDLWDVQTVFERVRPLCHPGTRVIMNFYSRLWSIPLALAKKVGLATPVLQQNWLTVADVKNLLSLAGFEYLRSWSDELWPVTTPLLAGFCNRFMSRIWPINHLALTNLLIARPAPVPAPVHDAAARPTVSVIIPARNEAGNINQIIHRVPDMGGGTELIFIEGHSTDETYNAIERSIQANPDRKAMLLRQEGNGKADAVRLGMSKATGDILMILDADLTVPPEDLPRFYEAIHSGKGEFINGVRLVYPMEDRAMQLINLAGNKFFGIAFSWLMGQNVKDTLCGTKVLWRRDYERLVESRSYFGDFDPFGDFELLFGAAKLNLKIADLPIRYRQRTYGSTNIHRWQHGRLLLRMMVFGARRLKFV